MTSKANTYLNMPSPGGGYRLFGFVPSGAPSLTLYSGAGEGTIDELYQMAVYS